MPIKNRVTRIGLSAVVGLGAVVGVGLVTASPAQARQQALCANYDPGSGDFVSWDTGIYYNLNSGVYSNACS